MSEVLNLRPKRFSKEYKNLIIEEHFEKGITISELARKHQVTPITIYNWKKQKMSENENQIDVKKLLEEISLLKKENGKLKKALGHVTLEKEELIEMNEFLKKKNLEAELKRQLNTFLKKQK